MVMGNNPVRTVQSAAACDSSLERMSVGTGEDFTTFQTVSGMAEKVVGVSSSHR